MDIFFIPYTYAILLSMYNAAKKKKKISVRSTNMTHDFLRKWLCALLRAF